jgi:hypothetical protein
MIVTPYVLALVVLIGISAYLTRHLSPEASLGVSLLVVIYGALMTLSENYRLTQNERNPNA